MAEYQCMKGHRWIAPDLDPYDCPTCYQESVRRSTELAENKQIMKEAMLEALTEFFGEKKR